MGDTNERVVRNNTELEKYIGREENYVIYDNERRLITVCIESDLIITNTKFTYKNIQTCKREVRSKNQK